ncbi:MAG TPA: hypothetical protein OIM48_00450 [Clostridiaceae bacterium]|nr:hypothetical protein [Clostridiaceae bacterium]
MTKEQEEAIKYLEKQINYFKEQINYFKEQIKFIEAVDCDYYDEEYELYKNRVKQFELVLNMLKENSAEMHQKNTELAEKNADIDNEDICFEIENKYCDKNMDYGECEDCIKQYFERIEKNERI